MKKALITGMNGFVGKYLQKALKAQGYQVAGTYLPEHNLHAMGAHYYPADASNMEQIEEVIQFYQPDEIYHLADSEIVFDNNKIGNEINKKELENLINATGMHCPKCKIIIVQLDSETDVLN